MKNFVDLQREAPHAVACVIRDFLQLNELDFKFLPHKDTLKYLIDGLSFKEGDTGLHGHRFTADDIKTLSGYVRQFEAFLKANDFRFKTVGNTIFKCMSVYATICGEKEGPSRVPSVNRSALNLFSENQGKNPSYITGKVVCFPTSYHYPRLDSLASLMGMYPIGISLTPHPYDKFTVQEYRLVQFANHDLIHASYIESTRVSLSFVSLIDETLFNNLTCKDNEAVLARFTDLSNQWSARMYQCVRASLFECVEGNETQTLAAQLLLFEMGHEFYSKAFSMAQVLYIRHCLDSGQEILWMNPGYESDLLKEDFNLPEKYKTSEVKAAYFNLKRVAYKKVDEFVTEHEQAFRDDVCRLKQPAQ